MNSAKEFCKKKNAKMILTSEHITKLPYMINHYPNITITFVCQDQNHKKHIATKKVQTRMVENIQTIQRPVDSLNDIANIKGMKSKYKNLILVKKLLDNGILTQQEFNEEKRKILLEK
jgi:hypothetical protein